MIGIRLECMIGFVGMRTTVKPQLPKSKPAQISVEIKNVLNGYEILNIHDFSWPVNIFRVEFADRSKQTHENLGQAKDIIWDLRKNACKSLWQGYGFVIDLSPCEVAVPHRWKLSQSVKTAEYSVSLARSFVATVEDAQGRAIVAGVLRDSIKRHFKDILLQNSESFGRTSMPSANIQAMTGGTST